MSRHNKLDTADLGTLLTWVPLPADLVASCTLVSQAVVRLTERGLMVKAARLCAHALPPREAVWWAARCAAATAPADLPQADREAGALAEAWVRKPADATCREAMARAQAAGCKTPEAWAALAAFWSGDSIALPNQPKVPPAPHLAGTAVAGAVILASVRPNAAKQAERLTRFLASAREIAEGGAGRIAKEAA
jgi:hypothetical protein